MTATLHNSGTSFATFNPVSSALAGLPNGPGTLVALVNLTADADADIFGLVTGSISDWFHTIQVGAGTGNNKIFDDDGLVGPITSVTNISGHWLLVAVTWGTGVAVERLSVVDLTAAGAWVHHDSDAANGGLRSGPSTANGILRIGYLTDASGAADIGMVAAWAGTRLSDAQVEALSTNGKTSDLWASAAGHPTTLVECTSTSPTDIGANPSTFSSNSGLALTGGSPPWTFDGIGSSGSTVTAPPADGTGDSPNASVAAGATIVSPVADGVGDVVNPILTASASVTSPVVDGVGDLVAPVAASGPDAQPVLTFDADPLHYVRFSWSGIDFTGPLSACFITHRTNPGDETDKRMLVLWDNDANDFVWEVEHSGGPVGGGEFSSFVTGPNGGQTGLGDAQVAPLTIGDWDKSWEIWFTWDGTYDFSDADRQAGTWHWRNLTDDPTTWHHVVSQQSASFARALLLLIPNGELFIGGNPNDAISAYSGGIGFYGLWAVNLSAHLNTDPLHTRVSELQAINPTAMRAGAQLLSTDPAQIVDLAGAGVICDTITAPLGVTIPEFMFDGEAPTLVSGQLDGTGDIPSPTVTGGVGSSVTAPPATGTGDVATPAVSAGATVTAPPVDGTGTLPPTNSIISAEVGTGPLIGTGGLLVPVVSASAAGTVVAPPVDGVGDLPDPGVSASSSIVSPVVDGIGSEPIPGVSAGATETSPVVDGDGDVPSPGITADAGVVTPVSDGTGDIPTPGLSASASVAPTPVRGAGDLFSPSVSGGRILPRIDLPTRVVLDPMITTATVYNPDVTSIIDGAITTHVLSNYAPSVALDPQIDSVILDGQPSGVLIDA